MTKHRRKSGRYDPDPRRRSPKGHRKGVEPAGLKRWRLAHKTHDPGRASSLWKGPRGGHYFRGPHKNSYDPAPRRRRFSGARRAGGKLEGGLNKYGVFLGAGISALAGVYTGYNDYQTAYGKNAAKNYWATIVGGDILDKNDVKLSTRQPEIAHLWTTDPVTGWDPITYLKYKFLGLEKNGNYKGSAWVYPFWIGFGATILRPIARLFTHKGDRILKPLQKVGIGILGVSTVGALALPGCPKKGDVANVLPPPPQNTQKPQVIQFTLGNS